MEDDKKQHHIKEQVGAALDVLLDNSNSNASVVFLPDAATGVVVATDTDAEAVQINNATDGVVKPVVLLQNSPDKDASEEDADIKCRHCNEQPCVVDVHYDSIMSLGEYEKACDKTPKEIRFKLYREATRLLHGYLGKNQRRKLPLCIVAEIHDAYPESAAEQYTGYKETAL